MKNFIVALNLKNNLIEVDEYFNNLQKNMQKTIIFPSFLQIFDVFKQNNKILLGSQNVQFNTKTITGEVTANQLKDIGVKYCLVGHSERRLYLNEDNNVISQKIKMLLENNITPVLCVGENSKLSLSDTFLFIKNQIDEVLANFDNYVTQKIILAYEPVFTIGTGIACDVMHIKNVINFIKQNYNFNAVLYGGSVNELNCAQILQVDALDGFLIGSASLSYQKINKIINIIENF